MRQMVGGRLCGKVRYSANLSRDGPASNVLSKLSE